MCGRRPRTIAPDLLSKSPRPPMFETVSDKKVMTDGTKTIEIYHMKGTSHNVANLLVFMPKEGLVFWGDGYNPPEGSDPRDFVRTPEQMIDLYRVITHEQSRREDDRARARRRREALSTI